ncbi:hypothetical protein [Lysinibacillus sp. 3P01SB]|uniref:hypothetical protein n=1 Tax=Lysinibacillus sp. 3P01SB TaxID=3132284 RepID=UPI0039A73D6D
MRKMLLQYCFRNMEGKLLAIPFFIFLFMGVFLLFEQTSFAFSSSLIVSVGIVTTLFLQFCRTNEKMFAVMPIPKREFIQVKFIFLLSTTCIYMVLFFTLSISLIRIQEGWSWNVWASTAGTALFIALLIVNLLLLVDNIPTQGASAITLILLMWGIFFALFLKPAILPWMTEVFHERVILLTAIFTIFLATMLNYRLSVLLIQKIDVP